MVCLCRVEGGVAVNKVSYAAIMRVITQHFSPKYGKGEEYCVTILKMAALLETWINVLLEVFEVLIQSSGLKSFPTN